MRQLDEGDVDAAWELSQRAFNLGDDRRERFQETFRPDRGLGLFEDGRMVGKLITHELGQWIGGRPVPMGGVSAVTVTPERRLSGVTSRLLSAELRRMRERGEVTSTLYPATAAPYRRAGWETAGHRVQRRVPLRSLSGLPHPDGVTLATLDLEGDLDEIRSVYDAVAASTPGWLVRDRWWFEQRVGWWRQSDRTYAHVCRDPAGDVTGYVVYHHTEGGDDEFYGLAVDELVALDGDATAALWRLLASNRGVSGRVTYHAGPDEPLFLLLAEQDTEVVSDWRWMTRIVDLPGALGARGWPEGVSVEVHLEVRDVTAPWNEGRWVVIAADGSASCEEGGRGSVRCQIGALAPLYTGMVTARTLARAGLLEATEAELAALDAAFVAPAPWMIDFF